MLQIIDEQRRPSFRSQLMGGLGQASSVASTQIPELLLGRQRERQENEALKRLSGKDVSGLSPELKKVFLEKHLGANAAKQESKMHAIDSLEHMRDIVRQGGTGFSFKALTPEGLGNRAAFDTAALNLEKLAADMVGKGTLNMQRFKYLKERLPSSWKTDAQNMKILDEWERILSEPESENAPRKKEKVKFNPKHPEHQAKARQLYSMHKDKTKVRKELEREFSF